MNNTNKESISSLDYKSNFYAAVNHNWLLNNPVPIGHSRYGRLDQLEIKIKDELLAEIKGRLISSNTENSDISKLLSLFNNGIHSLNNNKSDCWFISSLVRDIYNASNLNEIAMILAKTHMCGNDCFWGLVVDNDVHDSTQLTVYLRHTGIGMWNTNYYVDTTFENISSSYKIMLNDLYEAIGLYDVRKRIENTYDIESRLAKIFSEDVVLSESCSLPISMLCDKYREFPWVTYMNAMGLSENESITVLSKGALDEIYEILISEDIEKIKDYISAHLLINFSWYTSDKLYSCVSWFYEEILHGRTGAKDYDKRVLEVLEELMGDVLGVLYGPMFSDEVNIESAIALCESLRETFIQRLSKIEWMALETRTIAINKLRSMVFHIGWPESRTDYSTLSIIKDEPFIFNVLNIREWRWKYDIERYHSQCQISIWDISPHIPKPYYNPFINGVFIPAALLRPPFFNGDSKSYINNLGGLGSIIGHEMIHAFDSLGRQFNEFGFMQSWWTQKDEAEYECQLLKISKGLICKEFRDGKVRDNTYDELIADIGGLQIALQTLESDIRYIKSTQKDKILRDFYTSFAEIWATNYAREEIEYMNQNDSHLLSENRVNTAVQNTIQFHWVYNTQETDSMWKSCRDIISIW